MARVRFEGVSKIYPGGVRAVVDVTLDIQEREFLVLVGPSGCGKSTVLRLVAGLEQPTSGKILIGDREVSGIPPRDRDVAMVFQSYALYPHMTVRENIAFGLKLRKVAKEETGRRVGEAAELLGLTGVLDRKPRALSGGQRQRVALGRAIVRDPAVFLFDEPLSNLDAALRVQTRREIVNLHRQLRATMIYVTHDQAEAMTMADRIAVMKDGDLLQVDRPLDLYHRPASRFVASFIGSPAMNFLEGELVDGVFRAPGLAVPLVGKLPSSAGTRGPLTLGFRPEDIGLASEGGATGGVTATARVRAVEPLGNEVLLHAEFEGGTVVARIGPESTPEVGETVTLRFRGESAHLFSKDSGQSLLPGGRSPNPAG